MRPICKQMRWCMAGENHSLENQHSSARSMLINSAVMSIGASLVWYYSGPYVGEFCRIAYETYYRTIWGDPGVIDYFFVYLPNRGHAAHAGFEWGELVCAGLAAPFFYKISSKIQSFINHHFEEKAENQIAPEGNEQMAHLERAVNALSLENPSRKEGEVVREKFRTIVHAAKELHEKGNDLADPLETQDPIKAKKPKKKH